MRTVVALAEGGRNGLKDNPDGDLSVQESRASARGRDEIVIVASLKAPVRNRTSAQEWAATTMPRCITRSPTTPEWSARCSTTKLSQITTSCGDQEWR